MGLGYIIGPRIAGILCAGGVLAWLGLIPLISTLVPHEIIAAQLVKLGYMKSVLIPGGPGGWIPERRVKRGGAMLYRPGDHGFFNLGERADEQHGGRLAGVCRPGGDWVPVSVLSRHRVRCVERVAGGVGVRLRQAVERAE